MKKIFNLFIIYIFSCTLSSCSLNYVIKNDIFISSNEKYNKYYDEINNINEYIGIYEVKRKLLNYTIPNNIKIIGNYTFMKLNDYGVEKFEVYLPKSVEIIGNSAFRKCDLFSINLENVKYIQEYSFSKMEITNRNNMNMWYGGADAYKFNSLNLSSCILIEDNAFNIIKTTILLSDNIKYIGDYAFGYSHIYGMIYIPNTLEYLGENSFTFQTWYNEIDEKDLAYINYNGTLNEFLHLAPNSDWIGTQTINCTACLYDFEIKCTDRTVYASEIYQDYKELLNIY